ncbi:tryptophan synthase subunit alpha [Actinophytocola algeriensis]|uniref:tryptophan synthase n=1 Tax=Actinophytocola algeriensis TaxID=1768010 RepID=A0A7W7QG03_9PSEU|nr:tryptophan synthase subunit alpha [Actinophytocola algeriensis]MBB4912713.1 tryptophan synthase alpha chain [Actinophytocola algeriensis]MBE1473619.1 tryptophan synthase alpha chain [Actinophytocola algeriensis]
MSRASLQDLASAPRLRHRLGFGLYLIPGYPTWEASVDAVRAAVTQDVDFIEFPILRDRTFSARTGGPVAAALAKAHPDLLDLASPALYEWLDEIPAPVGVVYESAWPALDDCRIPHTLADRCAGLICEHNATPFQGHARHARVWRTPLVATIRATPDTVDAHDIDVLEHGGGFIYLALSGTTGERGSIDDSVARKIRAARDYRADLPVYAAFGIRTPDDVAAVAAAGADGFIVGSHALHLLGTGGLGAYEHWLRSMTTARATALPAQSR